MGGGTFSKEYTLQTIKQVIEEGRRIAEVSKSLGVTEQTIYRWLREYIKYIPRYAGQIPGEESFKGSGNARVDNEYIKQLEKKNKQLEQENEILKKFRVFQKGKRKKR